MGYGVSACATCDGFFFKNKKVLVVGGGDSAMEEATFLTKFASSVTIVHRRDKLRASKVMQEKAMNNEKIDFIWNAEVVEMNGDPNKNGLESVTLKNIIKDKIYDVKCDGLFLGIGHNPNSKLFVNQIDLNDAGYIITKGKSSMTSLEGVFAAGDIMDPIYKQAVTAAGTGCMAALDAEKYIEENV